MQFWLHATSIAPTELCEFAMLAEELGFFGMSLGEHLLQPPTASTGDTDSGGTESVYPYGDGTPPWEPEMNILDPWVAFAACAAVTSRLHFSTNVAIPIHQSVTWAKSIATTASLAPGRVTLGVGAGWMREEFAAADQDFTRRGRALDNSLDLMQQLWAGGSIEIDAGAGPIQAKLAPPLPPSRIPIMVGGESEIALRRAARHDGWLAVGVTDTALDETCSFIRAERERIGNTLPLQIIVGLDADEHDPHAYRRAQNLGATGITVSIPPVGVACTRQERIDLLRAFSERCIENPKS